MSNFNNKVVLVTGGGTGIGRAIAENFAEQEARVLIVGRREAPLRELSEQYPKKISFLQADVTKATDRKKMIQTAIDRYGHLDVLVNNAAVFIAKGLKETTDEEFEQSFKANVLAPASLVREAIPHLSPVKGSVINITTTVARSVMPGVPAFASSKAGLNHLTRILAAELGSDGIRVNAVAPGLTVTPLSEGMIEQSGDMMISMTPLGRLGQPDDIARAVLLLADENAGWITGQIVDASGGLMLA